MKTLIILLLTLFSGSAVPAQNVPEINITTGGAALLPVPVHVQGHIATPDGDPVGKAKLSVLPGFPEVFTTDSTGDFDFTVELLPGQSYHLKVDKNINPLNGVTTYDMILIGRYILGIENFTSFYQLIAADINGSNSVSAIDLVYIRKVILGIDSTLNGKSWRFVKAGCDSIPPPAGCSFDIVVPFFQPGDSLTGLDLIGIKMGDVNFSADGNKLGGDLPPGNTLLFSQKNARVKAAETVAIRFSAADFSNYSSPVLRLRLEGTLVDVEDYLAQGAILDFKNDGKEACLLSVHNPRTSRKSIAANDLVMTLHVVPNLEGRMSELVHFLPEK